MAISLNNHESRIKTLESNQVTRGSAITSQVLLSSAKSITNSFVTFATIPSGYNAVHIVASASSDIAYGHGITLMTACLNVETPVIHSPYDGGVEMISCILSGSNLQFKQRYSGNYGDNRVLRIVALKLYYSFSYNIIYKILLRKISRLCQKFTLLKQKECEIIWL